MGQTVACQVHLSMGFSRQEYWSGLPCPSSGDLSDPGIKPAFLVSPALPGGFFTTSITWEALEQAIIYLKFYSYHKRKKNVLITIYNSSLSGFEVSHIVFLSDPGL